MEISAISSSLTDFSARTQASAGGANGKISESCRQFEGMIWRQVLEKAMEPLLAEAGEGADSSGTYNYFLSSTIADADTSGKSSFSSLLEAQLTKRQQTTESR